MLEQNDDIVVISLPVHNNFAIMKLSNPINLPKSLVHTYIMLERVAQTHFVVGSTYDMDDSVSHGSEDMSHGRNDKEYVQYGESPEERYESREAREFRCAIARSEFGERKQVFGFVFKSWCAKR